MGAVRPAGRHRRVRAPLRRRKHHSPPPSQLAAPECVPGAHLRVSQGLCPHERGLRPHHGARAVRRRARRVVGQPVHVVLDQRRHVRGHGLLSLVSHPRVHLLGLDPVRRALLRHPGGDDAPHLDPYQHQQQPRHAPDGSLEPFFRAVYRPAAGRRRDARLAPRIAGPVRSRPCLLPGLGGVASGESATGDDARRLHAGRDGAPDCCRCADAGDAGRSACFFCRVPSYNCAHARRAERRDPVDAGADPVADGLPSSRPRIWVCCLE